MWGQDRQGYAPATLHTTAVTATNAMPSEQCARWHCGEGLPTFGQHFLARAQPFGRTRSQQNDRVPTVAAAAHSSLRLALRAVLATAPVVLPLVHKTIQWRVFRVVFE